MVDPTIPILFFGKKKAIGKSHPEFVSNCPSDLSLWQVPLNVTNEGLYPFVHDLYSELTQLFPDEYIHLGGDEVDLTCWNNSTSIHQWMILHNMTNVIELLEYFERDLIDYVINTTRKRPIVWQDLFDMNISGIPTTVVFDVWKDWIMEGSLYNITAANYDVIFSACWYLDHLNEDWWSSYTCNPRNMPNLTTTQQAHILGGHSSMWGERVDETDFYGRVWPRSSATAEVLWSGSPKNISAEISYIHVQTRLDRFRCYMLQQTHIPVSPITPGFCESLLSSISVSEGTNMYRVQNVDRKVVSIA